MIKKEELLQGLALIAIAIVMMASALGYIPDIPWFKLLCGTLFGIGTISALLKLDFVGMLFSASIVAWIFEEELMIEHLTPFPLVVAAILLGLGLKMIFGKKKGFITYSRKDRDGHYVEGSIDDVRKEEWQDGREVVLENVFNSTSKYVNAAPFSEARLENTFGSVNVYFDNANVYQGVAKIDLENNFGKMNIYLPGKWRAQINQESTFGNVRVHGEPNGDMDAPFVMVKAETNFGEINIYFD